MLILPIVIFGIMQIWSHRYVWQAGWWKIIIVDPGVRIEAFNYRQKDASKESFDFHKGFYAIPTEAEGIGRFRLPVASYIKDAREPIDFGKLALETKVSAKGYREVAEQKLALDLFEALKSKLIDETAFQIIVLIGMGIGFGGIAWFIHDKFEKLYELLSLTNGA